MDYTEKKASFNDFIELCTSAHEAKILPDLFEFFLTPEERQDIATRLLLVKELLQNKKTQREIAKAHNISIAKITRGSNELKRANKDFLTYLNEKLNVGDSL